MNELVILFLLLALFLWKFWGAINFVVAVLIALVPATIIAVIAFYLSIGFLLLLNNIHEISERIAAFIYTTITAAAFCGSLYYAYQWIRYGNWG